MLINSIFLTYTFNFYYSNNHSKLAKLFVGFSILPNQRPRSLGALVDESSSLFRTPIGI